MKISFQHIQDAARLIESHVVHTACHHSRTLSEITGAEVFLKFENHQFTGSFKERGALAKLLALSPGEKAQGVVAMSAGNHAQAVAYHAQRLKIPATIVMPRFTPNVKVEHTRMFGADVILRGEDLEEAGAFTQSVVRDKGLHLIHPYDDEKVIAGQGTVALEVVSDHQDLDALLIPLGGGGLCSGCAMAAKTLQKDIEIYGVQSVRTPSFLQAIRGEPISCDTATVAEGIAVKQPGTLTLPIVRELVREICLVDEREIERAILLLLEVEKTVVEGAGAVGLAALLKDRQRFEGRKVCVILSGGNIDLTILSSLIQRGLVKSGRLVRLRAELPDRPGALGEITNVLGTCDANIVEIVHQRSFTDLPLKAAEVEFVIQTRGLRHLQEIQAALREAGFSVSFPDQLNGRLPT